MRLDEYLDPELVLPNLQAGTKPEVLREMTGAIAARHPHLDADLALSVLLDREGLGTTGIGDGVAIPHGKLANINKIAGIFARLETPVDFEALDDQPVDLVFLLLAPDNAGADHLKALSRIARMLRDADTVAKLRGTHDA